MLDPLSVVLPARVRCLCIPIGDIRRSRFTSFVDRLQQENVVHLQDVTPDPQRTTFSPLSFPTGRILWDISPAIPPPSHLALAPFELHREPLIISGIADSSQFFDEASNGPTNREGARMSSGDESLSVRDGIMGLSRSLAQMQGEYPNALVHIVLMFNHDIPTITLPRGVIPVPSPERSRITTMKTVMATLASLLLAEMAPFAQALSADTPKSPPALRTPNGDMPSFAAHMDEHARPFQSANVFPETRPSSPAFNNKSHHRMTMPPALEGSRISTANSRPFSPVNGTRTPPVSGDEMARASSKASPAGDSRSQSRDRVAISALSASNTGQREKHKGRGRVRIVIGSMYLLAGRWVDAVRELVEGSLIARANTDHIWHAKALDQVLVCLLMCAWAGMDFHIPQVCYVGLEKANSTPGKPSNNSIYDLSSPRTSNPANRLVSLQNLTNLLPDLVNNILNIYARAAESSDEQVPPLTFSETTIRLTKLLTIVHLSLGQLNDQGLQHAILNTKITEEMSPYAQLTAFPSRASITAVLFRAFPLPSPETGILTADRVIIFAGIASVLSELGYHRKKAFVLRELLSTLIPALIQARKAGAAEMGIHPAAGLASLDVAMAGMEGEDSDGLRDESESGLHNLLVIICHIYGVFPSNLPARTKQLKINDREAETLDGNDVYDRSTEAIVSRILRQASLQSFGAQHLKQAVLRSCINFCEALPDLRGVLRFSTDLLRTASSGIAPKSESTDGSPALTFEDQIRLSNNLARTVNAVRQLGLRLVEAKYWDEFLVRGVELVATSSSQNLVLHEKSDIEAIQAAEAQKEKSPFLYNAYSKSTKETEDSLLVAQEKATFVVTLQNLYEFDVEVEWLKLESHGMVFDGQAQGTVIGPHRMQSLYLNGTPYAEGTLGITGCIAKIKGCYVQRFPIFGPSWKPKQSVKLSLVNVVAPGHNKSRPISISSDSGKTKDTALRSPEASTLSLKVIAAQPVMVLKESSAAQSAVMLIEGERKIVRITLQNTSSAIAVDTLIVSFVDSSQEQIRSALTSRELSAAEIYELEHSSLEKPAFRRINPPIDSSLIVAPGEAFDLEIEVFGKPGLFCGVIQVDYGYLGLPTSEISSRFYIRQLTVPLTTAVDASIEIVQNDIISVSASSLSGQAPHNTGNSIPHLSTASATEGNPQSNIESPSATAQSTLQSSNSKSPLQNLDTTLLQSTHALLILDLRNSYSTPLTFSLYIRLSPHDPFPTSPTHDITLQPHLTTRLPLHLPFLYLPDPHRPIPSLLTKKRQFVISSTTTDAESERRNRETFWYREELLKHIRGTWSSTHRSGEIDLRAIRLTTAMLTSLTLPDLDIIFSIQASPSSLLHRSGPSTHILQTHAFYTVLTTLHNRSSHPIHPLLRLQPSLRNQPADIALDLSRRFAFSGVLQKVCPVLEAGGTWRSEMGFEVLASGEYEIAGCVEEVRVLVREAEEGAGGGKERRVWWAREGCVVIARDEDGEG